ncbi:hypothetical protein HKX48_001725 [Thoreauomyces humboldtii]|nr:hypothetical protein HKX48_001725 [Thoreauomyces humboldtii]
MHQVEAVPDGQKISDLAATARQDAKADPWWKKIQVPLLALAPLILVLSLAAVVIPICVVLLNSSNETTEDLSETFFTTLMKASQASILKSVVGQKYAVDAFAGLPSTAQAMTNQNNLLGETGLWRQLAHIMQTYDMDQVTCSTAAWLPGYGPPALGTWNTTLLSYMNAGHSVLPPTDVAIAVMDYGSPANIAQYQLNETALTLRNMSGPFFMNAAVGGAGPPLNYANYVTNGYIWPSLVLYGAGGFTVTTAESIQELLLPTPRRNPFFSVSTNAQGIRGATITQIFTSADPTLNYACGATISVDSTWSALLIDAATVSPSSVIMLLDNDEPMTLLSTSNRNISYLQTLTQQASAYANETLSPLLRQAVLNRYSNYDGLAAATSSAYSSFDATVQGEIWIIMVSRVALTTYDVDQLVVVTATPRRVIFSKIDSARKKSLGIAVGLSVGISLMMAGLFALIVAPLRRLSIAMQMLTQMDFASLHKGDILSQKSAISEIRNVQGTFSTMVKAFAGGIKKNRDLTHSPAKQSAGMTSTASAKVTRLEAAGADNSIV